MAEADAPSTTVLTRTIFALLESKIPGNTASRRLMQTALLAYLARMQAEGDPITVAALCTRLNAPRHLVAKLLKSLIDMGFVARSGTSPAGRVYVVSLPAAAAANEAR